MVLKRQWKECNERQSGAHWWGGESKCRCRTVCAARRRYAAERLILCSTLCRATRNRHSPPHVCVCVCLHVIALPCHHFASFSPSSSHPFSGHMRQHLLTVGSWGNSFSLPRPRFRSRLGWSIVDTLRLVWIVVVDYRFTSGRKIGFLGKMVHFSGQELTSRRCEDVELD